VIIQAKKEFIKRVRSMKSPILKEFNHSSDLLNLSFFVSSGFYDKFFTRGVRLTSREYRRNCRTGNQNTAYYKREAALRKQINNWFNEAITQK